MHNYISKQIEELFGSKDMVEYPSESGQYINKIEFAEMVEELYDLGIKSDRVEKKHLCLFSLQRLFNLCEDHKNEDEIAITALKMVFDYYNKHKKEILILAFAGIVCPQIAGLQKFKMAFAF